MDLELRWVEPYKLANGKREGLIYKVPDLDEVSTGPGVYVFTRVHGKAVFPLYIGKATNLRRRIEQHIKSNVRLMRGIEDAPAGYRRLHIGELVPKGGQVAEKAVRIIESALIRAALADGYDIFNIKGTKALVHTISNRGNRDARLWLRSTSLKVERA